MITSSSYLSVNKDLARQVGLDAAVLFAELASAQNLFCPDGCEDYFFRTGQHLQDATTLSPKVQRKAIEELKKAGILKTKLLGMPATLHFKIDAECLSKLLQLCPNGTTRNAQKAQQVVPKMPTIKKENKNKSLLPETISEELKKAIDKFFEYRTEIGKKFKSETSISAKMTQFIQQAEKHSEQAVIESIETAIANGWQGTFIDKKYTQTHTQSKFQNYGTANSKTSGKESIANFIKQSVNFELD